MTGGMMQVIYGKSVNLPVEKEMRIWLKLIVPVRQTGLSPESGHGFLKAESGNPHNTKGISRKIETLYPEFLFAFLIQTCNPGYVPYGYPRI